jgi:hypothetical protein
VTLISESVSAWLVLNPGGLPSRRPLIVPCPLVGDSFTEPTFTLTPVICGP